MSLYEILVFAALTGVAGFAYYLYRSDTQRKSPGAEAGKAETASGQLMFGRVSPDRPGERNGPDSRH
jgi:hypothetical protein